MNVSHEIDLLVQEIQRLGSKSKFMLLFYRIVLDSFICLAQLYGRNLNKPCIHVMLRLFVTPHPENK